MLSWCISAWSISHRREELEPAVNSGEQVPLGRQKTSLLSCFSVLYWFLSCLLPMQLRSRSNTRTELERWREGMGRRENRKGKLLRNWFSDTPCSLGFQILSFKRFSRSFYGCWAISTYCVILAALLGYCETYMFPCSVLRYKMLLSYQ